MRNLEPTNHGVVRMAQRGFALHDADLIMMLGTEVEGGYLMRHRDYQEIEEVLKRFLGRVRRMQGKRLVLASGRIVTAYHANDRVQRRLMRNARDDSLYEY